MCSGIYTQILLNVQYVFLEHLLSRVVLYWLISLNTEVRIQVRILFQF